MKFYYRIFKEKEKERTKSEQIKHHCKSFVIK